jgi:putative sugar O-methyltransferase
VQTTSASNSTQLAVKELTYHYLQPNNPRLEELRRRYQNHPATRHSLWSPQYIKTQLQLDKFRADNLYLHQCRSANKNSYLLTARYVQSVDKLGLLGVLKDDELFGNYLVSFNGLQVSRDLLDSALEINFLNDHLRIANGKPVILDIGAGYGRLAYRLIQALPNVEGVLCTDAIPESTFLSEFYLRFRGCHSKAEVVPLDQVEARLRKQRIDIAVNVHSFSECTLDSVRWWLDLITAKRIPFLFIVPNGDALDTSEANRTHLNYVSLLLTRGYRLIARQPNYAQSQQVQRYGLYPSHYYLFARN